MKTGMITGLAGVLLVGAGAYLYLQTDVLDFLKTPELEYELVWDAGVGDATGRALDGITQAPPDLSKAQFRLYAENDANWLRMARYLLSKRDGECSADVAKFTQELDKKIEDLEKQIGEKKSLMLSLADDSPESHEKVKELNRQLIEAKAEKAAPWTLDAALNSPQMVELLDRICCDRTWLNQILFSGECARPGRVLAILGEIFKKHPEARRAGVMRDIATATALEYARAGYIFASAEQRADHFIRNWKAGKLNTGFDKLPFWQMRIVCGAKGNHSSGTPEAMQWAVDNLHLPAQKFCGCYWRCGYKLHNIYGESIHGAGYGEPFKGIFDNNHYTFTQNVGGVCGSLSHYGAYAACANGIPAMTAGEPGHCALVVLVNGKWTPAYSLSWQRGLHWTVWKDMHRFSSLHMQTELMGEKAASKTDLSNAYRMVARAFADTNDKDRASKAYQAAVNVQPLNYLAWREYAEYLKASKAKQEAWMDFNTRVCDTLSERYPEMSAEILRNFLYPELAAAASSYGKNKLEECFLNFWKPVERASRNQEKLEPDAWPVAEMCKAQLDIMKKLGGDEKQVTLDFYTLLLTNTFVNRIYAPKVLAWGTEMAAQYKGDMPKRMMEANVVALSAKGGAKMDPKARDKMIGELLVNCENSRDLNSFNNLSELLSKEYTEPKAKMPSFEPFKGRLMSERGVPYFSSVSKNFGQPSGAGHPGLLKPCGGNFHTDKEENPWAAIMLVRPAMVSGVVVVCTSNNTGRLNNMHIQVSEDGESWTDVGPAAAPYSGEVMRFDMGAEADWPRAKYVRVIRDGGPEFFHLRGIYVYGKKAA